MTVMTIDLADAVTSRIPTKERHLMQSIAHPPANWIIGVAKYDGHEAPGTWHHRAFALVPSKLYSGPRFIPDQCRGQITALYLGHLFLYALSCGDTAFRTIIDADRLLRSMSLEPLWPLSERPLPEDALAIDDARCAAILGHFGNPRVVGPGATVLHP
jgi:hypothetical protein